MIAFPLLLVLVVPFASQVILHARRNSGQAVVKGAFPSPLRYISYMPWFYCNASMAPRKDDIAKKKAMTSGTKTKTLRPFVPMQRHGQSKAVLCLILAHSRHCWIIS